MAKTHRKSIDFAEYEPPKEAPLGAVLRREDLAGLPVDNVVDRILAAYVEREPLEDVTRDQKANVLRRVLNDFSRRGLHLSNLTPRDVSIYRTWLWDRVKRGEITENSAAHIAVQWNAMMNVVFGEKPFEMGGSSLKMKAFRQTPKDVRVFNEEEYAAMLRAAQSIHHRSHHHKEAFLTYLEVIQSSAGRVGSLLTSDLKVSDVDFEKGVLRFRHVKNMDGHEVVLSSRAVNRLRSYIDYLQTTDKWQGIDKTPLFIGNRGTMLTGQWSNRTLKRCVARAGIGKYVTNHIMRKSTGTIMARKDPKLAREQLGITQKVFDRHYDMPTIEDRLNRRDIVPGERWTPATKSDRMEDLIAKFSRGDISREALMSALEQIRTMDALPAHPNNHSPEVA